MRRDRFLFERDRHHFTLAHALLRRSLSMLADLSPCEWQFVTQALGKPVLQPDIAAQTCLSFNLSHTDGIVACIVAVHADLGLDVEAMDRRIETLDLARNLFSPEEVADLERCLASDRPARFTEIWTLKEAFVKGLGDGLSHSLQEFAFALDRPGSIRCYGTNMALDDTWCFALFAPSARHRMAIAVSTELRHARRLVVRVDPPGTEHPSQLLRTSHCSRLIVREETLAR